MPDREPATDRHDQQEADGGYFARLERAKSLLLTTFEPDGTPISTPVRGVADGDRAYFCAWGRSGSVRRLQHTDAVQVTPCSLRGFLIYGSPLDATARMLPGERASHAAGKLARKNPVRHRFLTSLSRRRMVHYELLAGNATGDRGQSPEGSRTPYRQGARSGEPAEQASREFVRIQCAQVHATDHGAASIASIWPAPAARSRPRAGQVREE